MTQPEQINEAAKQAAHEADVKRMIDARPDIPAAIWDIEASEEMALMWDESQGW